jgi:hypothetical protein
MIELGRLVEDFAAAIQRADGRRPKRWDPGQGARINPGSVRILKARRSGWSPPNSSRSTVRMQRPRLSALRQCIAATM